MTRDHFAQSTGKTELIVNYGDRLRDGQKTYIGSHQYTDSTQTERKQVDICISQSSRDALVRGIQDQCIFQKHDTILMIDNNI